MTVLLSIEFDLLAGWDNGSAVVECLLTMLNVRVSLPAGQKQLDLVLKVETTTQAWVDIFVYKRNE